MLYPDLFRRMEKARWNLETDIPWADFDETKMTEEHWHSVAMNAVFEWSAMPTAEMFLRDNPDDVDFAAFMSIWFFEEQKHSLTLLEYLRRFAPERVPSEDELASVRFPFDPAPPLDSLTLHFCGEIRLNHWYRCASEWHTEPVIKKIYRTTANDEARHSHAYFEYMQRAIREKGDEAKDAFLKIGVLMLNPRLNKAMHPTNLHVNKALYPNDTVNSRCPEPGYLERWLNTLIHFDDSWEDKVNSAILRSFSNLFETSFADVHALRTYRKALMGSQPIAEAV